MKKILQIVNYQYPHIGGIEQVARSIADVLLERKDIQQKMICFNENAQVGSHVCHRKETVHEMVDGVEVIRCGCFAKVASQSLSLTYPRKLREVLAEFKPDILIFHYPNPFVCSFLLKMLDRKTKLIVYWHLDITKQKVIGKLFHRQNIRLLKKADQVIATSPNYIEGSPYLNAFKDKCSVVPNCIDTRRFAVNGAIEQKAEEIRQRHQGKIICFSIGRHVLYKGLTYLIEASRYLDDRFVILIAGSGELTDSLKEQAKRDQKVRFLGRISDQELAAYYKACDILAFPSITKNEAFGLALAEGMYFGNPAVTFTIPGSGVNYVNLDGVTGIECPNGDAKAYADALMKLASDEELCNKYGKNARQRVLECFTKKQFIQNIYRMVSEI